MEGSQKQHEIYTKVAELKKRMTFIVESKSNQELGVIKIHDLKKLGDEDRKEVLIDAKILEVLSHPNIIRFREVYKTKKKQLCIVMDYADNGNLKEQILQKYRQKIIDGVPEYYPEE